MSVALVWREVSSANKSHETCGFDIDSGRSLIKMLNKRGPRTDPCGIPCFIGPGEENLPLQKTNWLLFVRYDFRKGNALEFPRYSDNF